VIAGMVILALLAALSWWWIAFDPRPLLSLDGLRSLADLADQLWPPATSEKLLARANAALWQTLAISVAGSALAAGAALLLAPLCCTALSIRGPLVDARRPRWIVLAAQLVHQGARLLANGLRTVPYLVLALLLVLMVGLGPFPGALAIALHTAGVLARLYAQAIDELDPAPLAALRDAGATPLQVYLFGVLPAARAQFVSLALYRWEVNVREAAILGFVGAGGLGFELARAIGEFNRPYLGTLLIAVMTLVLACEGVSWWLRRRLV
jgi:phosphonate transport system permease protein